MAKNRHSKTEMLEICDKMDSGQTTALTVADPNQINLNRRSSMAKESLPKDFSIDNLCDQFRADVFEKAEKDDPRL